jgi:hypothetical protein
MLENCDRGMKSMDSMISMISIISVISVSLVISVRSMKSRQAALAEGCWKNEVVPSQRLVCIKGLRGCLHLLRVVR